MKKSLCCLFICCLFARINTLHWYVLNDANLKLIVMSQHNDFFQPIYLSNQIKMASHFPHGEEILDVICSKLSPGLENGTPRVFVNSIPLNQTNRCINCLSQKFIFNTSNLIKESRFDIECRLHNGTEKIESSFHRIFSDSLPRIRNGSYLYKHGNIIVHNFNSKSLSCESIKPTTGNLSDRNFDSINWYDENENNLYFPFSIVKTIDKIENFTALFDQNSDKIDHNKIYKCCTSLKNKLVNCQNIYVVRDRKITTTVSTTISSSTKSSSSVTRENLKSFLSSNKMPLQSSKAFSFFLVTIFSSFRKIIH